MLPFTITIPNPAAAISLLPSAGAYDVPLAGIIFQPDDGASGPFFVGGPDVNGTTLYWFRINAPAGGVPPAALPIGPFMGVISRLSQLYVIGTAGDILRVTAIPR